MQLCNFIYTCTQLNRLNCLELQCLDYEMYTLSGCQAVILSYVKRLKYMYPLWVKVLLTARITHVIILFYLIKRSILTCKNENMILKEVKRLYVSRLCCHQAGYCLLRADHPFSKIRLFQRRVKNHSKNKPSWFWYMFYNNIKLLSTAK